MRAMLHAARLRTPGSPRLLLAILALACADPAPTRFGRDAGLVQRMLAAEDARPDDEAALAPLLDGTAHADAEVRRLAVRGLGRQERATLIPRIAALLDDAAPVVRTEAANALAQAARGGEPETARRALIARLGMETHARVSGALAESVGRLPHASAEAATATANLLAGLRLDLHDAAQPGNGADADTSTAGALVALRLGVARGLFFLVRQPVARGAVPHEAASRLRELLVTGLGETIDTLRTRRVRTVAAAALTGSGQATGADLALMLDDPSELVRREGAAGLAGFRGTERADLVAAALADASPVVRYDALRALVRGDETGVCGPILAATRDPGPHVALQAIDLTAARCTRAAAAPLVDSIAGALTSALTGWHAPAHALVALATLAPDRARARLPAFLRHPSFFARAWATRAAAILLDADALYLLAVDLHPNVRTAAINGLATLVGHAADDVYIAQLDAADSQLLQSAAAALEGSTHAEALPALTRAFERVTALQRETLYEARRALLERIAELGSQQLTEWLQPWLRDHDARIAEQAAGVIDGWTGSRPRPAPVPLPRAAVPAVADLEALARARIVIELGEYGVVELALRPWDAPTNSARFARLARAGWFDGLTFHRVAPNFVVQGGSPNANEYAGDGPYSRDELVLDANWRGTVGLSTRGRDTGDAQIFINLIDNVRLDHDYTVFADVVRGMDLVDRLLEGAVMHSVTVR